MSDMSPVSPLAPAAAETELSPEVALVLQRMRLRGWRRAAWLDHLVHGAQAGNGSIAALRDGDALFALSTGARKADVSTIGAFAAEAVAEAILRAARSAETAGGLPGFRKP